MIKIFRGSVVTTATLAALAACAGGEPSAAGMEGPAVRDSAGVRIVVNRLPEGPTPIYATVDPEPLLVLPSPESGVAAVSVRGAVTLSDGRVAVGYGGILQVRYHEGDSVVRAAGGRGADPGRLQGMGALGVARGDTLWVSDPVGHKLILVAPEGVEGQEAVLPFDGAVVGRFGDGSYLAERSRPSADPAPPGRVVRDTADYLRWWPRTGDTAWIATVPGEEWVTLQPDSGGAVTLPAPLGRSTPMAVGPGRLYLGDPERAEIRGLEPDGTLRERIRLDGVDRTVPPDLASSFALVDARGRIPGWADEYWSLARDTRPAFGRILLDAMGHLWVAEHVVTSDPPGTWRVFAPDGALRGRVDVPDGSRLLEIGVNHLLVVDPTTQEVRRHLLDRR